MSFFVEVTGSYDAVHVGPFDDMIAAQLWVNNNLSTRFDYAIMTDAERRASNAEFGELTVQSP